MRKKISQENSYFYQVSLETKRDDEQVHFEFLEDGLKR